MAKNEVLITDFTICQPKESIAERGAPGKWWKATYLLKDGVSGIMLYADPKDNPPVLTLKPELSGKYKIFVGVNYPFQYYAYGGGGWGHRTDFDYGSIWLKLNTDEGYSRFGVEKYDHHAQGEYRTKVLPEKSTKEHYSTIYETYWKTEEMDGKYMLISIPKPPYDTPEYGQVANISYIRFVPADSKDAEFDEKLKDNKNTRNMASLWCAGALTGHTVGQPMYHPTDGSWFDDEIEALRNSDFGIMCVEAMRGNLCLFKTKYGDVGTVDKSWDEKWVVPLEEFVTKGHKAGLEVFASLRMMGAGRAYNRNPINWARHYWDHPEWSKRDEEGIPVSNISLAYPEARQHWLNLISEALDYGIDGIQLHLNRGDPFVLFEEPVVRDFIEKYGIDPRGLPENDKRRQEHAASYLTQFIREIRQLLDKKPGRKLSAIFAGFSTFKPGQIVKGCDPDTWMKESLLNIIMADHSTDLKYINYWKELSGGKVRILCSLMPRTQPGEAYAALARKLYKAGADGFCVWDCERRFHRASEWAILKHLGHRDLLDELENVAPSYFKACPMKTHMGLQVKYSYRDG